MTDLDDDLENLESDSTPSKISKKKILVFLLPILIVIGLAVGIYHIFGTKTEENVDLPYSVIPQADAEGNPNGNQLLIFYDLPEISTRIKTSDGSKQSVRIKISIELSQMEDIKNIETLLPRLNDIIISHTSELTADEISGVNGLYWLKEELLHRINLVTAPIKIENLNVKSFETQKNN